MRELRLPLGRFCLHHMRVSKAGASRPVALTHTHMHSPYQGTREGFSSFALRELESHPGCCR